MAELIQFPEITDEMAIQETERIKAATKVQVIHSLWRKKDLFWKLEEQQKKAYKRIKEAAQEPNNRFVLNASRRWGKTYLLAVLAIEFALSHPDALILYTACTQKMVKDMILPTFKAICNDAPFDLQPKFKTQSNQFVFNNGAKIKLSGLDNNRAENLRGQTAHLIVVDEAGFVDKLEEAVTAVLFPMTSTTGGQTILASNAPLSPGHPFVQVFTRKAERTGNYLKQTVFDIPKFTKEQIDKFAEECGGYDSATFKREYECLFVTDEKNAVIPEWGKFKQMLIHDDIPKPAFYHSMVSIDLGLVDFTAVLFGYWHFTRGMAVIEDELLLRGVNSEKLVELCRKKEIELWGEDPPKPVVRVADGQPYTINDIVTVHKYSVGMVTKDNVEAQANAIRLDIQACKLIVHPRCVNLIGQMEDATWNNTRTSFARDVENGHFDLVAALQYFVRHINRHSNPFPPHYQVDLHNTVIKDSKFNNPSLQSLQKLLGPKQETRSRYHADNMASVFSSGIDRKRRR